MVTRSGGSHCLTTSLFNSVPASFLVAVTIVTLQLDRCVTCYNSFRPVPNSHFLLLNSRGVSRKHFLNVELNLEVVA